MHNILRLANRPSEILRAFISPFTPSDNRRSFQFVSGASSFKEFSESSQRVHAHIERVKMVFDQNKAAIEAIQAQYDRYGSAIPEISVRADEAALRSRRILAGMV